MLEPKIKYSNQNTRIVIRKAIKEHYCIRCGYLIPIKEEKRELSFKVVRNGRIGYNTIYICKYCWRK